MKLGESDLQAVLGRVAELARQALPGMAGASVTLAESDRAFTAAFSGQLALDLDETQAGIRTPSPRCRRALLPIGGPASPGTPPSPSPTSASTRARPHWLRTCGGRWKPLTRLSQTTHRELRDCAADLVTSTAKDRPAE
jgi:hypothetical protein